MPPLPNSFVWYELMTSDAPAAAAFYGSVVGWNTRSSDQGAFPYTVLNAGERPVGGLMRIPDELWHAGRRPGWIGYVGVPDVDLATDRLRRAGGAVHRDPADIPEIGRFSVVADPQGAAFILFTPRGGDDSPAPMGAPGHIGWRELYATDWATSFLFYADQFGWTKAEAVDMGPMGVYQLFAAGGDPIGGMMNKPDGVPSPAWLFYFNVDAIDAAAARVTAGGGRILNGPHQVPGGSWILQGIDPQGAMFALAAQTR
jgi:predicted enzyme related to lactoylglutathione lyase